MKIKSFLIKYNVIFVFSLLIITLSFSVLATNLLLINHYRVPIQFKVIQGSASCLNHAFPFTLRNQRSVLIRTNTNDDCDVGIAGNTWSTILFPKKSQKFVMFDADFNHYPNYDPHHKKHTVVSGYIGSGIAYSWNHDHTKTTTVIFCTPSLYKKSQRCSW